MFCKKAVLKNFPNSQEKIECQSLFSNKVANLRPATLSKKKLWRRFFPVNFAKFLRATYFKDSSGSCLCIERFYQTYLSNVVCFIYNSNFVFVNSSLTSHNLLASSSLRLALLDGVTLLSEKYPPECFSKPSCVAQ